MRFSMSKRKTKQRQRVTEKTTGLTIQELQQLLQKRQQSGGLPYDKYVEFLDQVLPVLWGIRGAMLLSGDGVKNQTVVVYAYKTGEPRSYDFMSEMDVVRSGLAELGMEDDAAMISPGGGYLLVVSTLEPWETEPTSEFDGEQLSEKGLMQRNIQIMRLTELAWKAWAVTKGVDLTGPATSLFKRKK
jgi:hypothetical protein